MSFKMKTLLGIASIEAILLLILVWHSVNLLSNTNEDQLIKRAYTTAKLFAATTKNAVISYDLASLESFVNEIMKSPDLVYVRVTNSK